MARPVIADAWVALRSPPITHQSRALEIPREPEHGALSEARPRSSVTAGTPEYTYVHTRYLYGRTRVGKKKERKRDGSNGGFGPRACPRACVRDSYYPPRCPYYEEGNSSGAHAAVSCDTVYKERGRVDLKENVLLLLVVSVSLREIVGQANKRRPPEGNEHWGPGFFVSRLTVESVSTQISEITRFT